jgi:aspartate kinase
MSRVLKFGGGIMPDADSIRKVPDAIRKYNKGETLLVFSAFWKTTDKLGELAESFYFHEIEEAKTIFNRIKEFHLSIAKDLIGNNRKLIEKIENIFDDIWTIGINSKNFFQLPFLSDQITSMGEIIATEIIAEYLSVLGFDIQIIFAPNFIRTDLKFGDAKINQEETSSNIRQAIPSFLNGKIGLTQGFIGGSSLDFKTNLGSKIWFRTTVGREGSDLIAAEFGDALRSDLVVFFKNVDGIMDKDPNVAGGEDAKLINNLSYERCEQLLHGTAKKILHERTIEVLKRNRVPALVTGINNLDIIGTTIS